MSEPIFTHKAIAFGLDRVEPEDPNTPFYFEPLEMGDIVNLFKDATAELESNATFDVQHDGVWGIWDSEEEKIIAYGVGIEATKKIIVALRIASEQEHD